jgi:hypothetical protein
VSKIIEAIQKHGAKAVYEAAMARFAGNGQGPLDAVGLGASTLGDAHEIAGIAYEHMTRAEQAQDYWTAAKVLNELR